MNIKLLTLLLFCLFSNLVQAEIVVNVDRNPVVVDESFQLTFESNEKVKGEPDFSPLNKNFTILKTGRRSNTQIINGDFKQSHQWILTVMAKKTGLIDIPPINFGKRSSQPYKLKVVNSAPPRAGNKSDDIFIEVEVNKNNPYVQEQIIYTVKLYRAVQTSNATLSDPEISGDQAVVTRLGEDSSFETRIKGKRYVVVQRQYAIFPQSSGTLKIEPILFQGQTGAGGFFNFDPFGPQPKSIVKRSDSIVLDIQAIPDTFTGDTWLPASQLNIQEQWSIDPSELKQGEATTRSLTIIANGLASSHLPAIDSKLPDYLKQYPDQPELDEKYDENGFIGSRREKMAIIPTESGDFSLPAIKIPWWNTKTNKMEVAELPERPIHVNVSDSISVDEKIKNVQAENEINYSENNADQQLNNEKEILNASHSVSDKTPWKWISLALFLLWIITIYIFWKNNKQAVVTNEDDSKITKHQKIKELKKACSDNDAKQAKQVLLDWARLMWPDERINNINSIKEFCDDDLKLNIDLLNTSLYGKQQQTWDGMAFLKCFESQSFNNKKSTIEKGNLEPLYKS